MERMIIQSTPSTKLDLADLSEGDVVKMQMDVTAASVEAFMEVSNDRALGHVDPDHARRLGFQDRIVHGMYTVLPFSRMLGMFLPGPNCVIQGIEFKFKREVYIGDTLMCRAVVDRIVPAVRTVRMGLRVERLGGEVVCSGIAQCVFAVKK